MKCVIASSKIWRPELLETVKSRVFGEWYLINAKDELNEKILEEIEPDYIFFTHWSYIISENIYKNYKCVVFHMTDLPYGRGGSPLQNLIVHKVYETKISALRVEKGLDTGDIYLKKNLSLYGSAEEIFIRANHLIEDMIVEITEKNIITVKQEGDPIHFKRRKPEMSNIASLRTLNELFDHIRMLDADGYPKAFLETDMFKIEFSRASMKADESIIADVRISKK